MNYFKSDYGESRLFPECRLPVGYHRQALGVHIGRRVEDQQKALSVGRNIELMQTAALKVR
jgi:hypothetical protein